MFLLTISAAATTLITEGVKKTITTKKPTIVAAVVSVIVGILVPVGYMILCHITITEQDVVYIVAMVVMTWLSATLGYDKVWQFLEQMKGGKE